METWNREGAYNLVTDEDDFYGGNRDGAFYERTKSEKPAIVAYYRNPPSNGEDGHSREIRLPPGKQLEHAAIGDQRNLQRVQILSPDLQDEMRLLTSIVLQPPVM